EMRVSGKRSGKRSASRQFVKCFLGREGPSDFCWSAASPRRELVDVRFSLLSLVVKIRIAHGMSGAVIPILVIRLARFCPAAAAHKPGIFASAARLVSSSTCV